MPPEKRPGDSKQQNGRHTPHKVLISLVSFDAKSWLLLGLGVLSSESNMMVAGSSKARCRTGMVEASCDVLLVVLVCCWVGAGSMMKIMEATWVFLCSRNGIRMYCMNVCRSLSVYS